MARALPSEVFDAMFNSETGAVALVMLTLDHPTLAEPIRVVNDTQSKKSNGNTFIGFPFSIRILGDAEVPRSARISIQNIDSVIVRAVENLETAVSVTIEIALDSDPDDIWYTAEGLDLTDIFWDGEKVEGQISRTNYARHQFARAMTPANFTGIVVP